MNISFLEYLHSHTAVHGPDPLSSSWTPFRRLNTAKHSILDRHLSLSTISNLESQSSLPRIMYLPAQFYELALSAASRDAESMNTNVATGLIYVIVLVAVTIVLEILCHISRDSRAHGTDAEFQDISPWSVTLTAEGELLPKEGSAYYQPQVPKTFPRKITGFGQCIGIDQY